jgi:hypothetical protein
LEITINKWTEQVPQQQEKTGPFRRQETARRIPKQESLFVSKEIFLPQLSFRAIDYNPKLFDKGSEYKYDTFVSTIVSNNVYNNNLMTNRCVFTVAKHEPPGSSLEQCIYNELKAKGSKIRVFHRGAYNVTRDLVPSSWFACEETSLSRTNCQKIQRNATFIHSKKYGFL